MSNDPETVWVLPRKTAGGRKRRLHTDPDCHLLAQSDREPSEKERNVFHDDAPMCRWCTGQVEFSTGQRKRRRYRAERSKCRHDVVDALVRAEKPLTRRDLELETHRSAGQVQRTLRDLRDRGRVEQVDTDDGRIPAYRLAGAPQPVVGQVVEA